MGEGLTLVESSRSPPRVSAPADPVMRRRLAQVALSILKRPRPQPQRLRDAAARILRAVLDLENKNKNIMLHLDSLDASSIQFQPRRVRRKSSSGSNTLLSTFDWAQSLEIEPGQPPFKLDFYILRYLFWQFWDEASTDPADGEGAPSRVQMLEFLKKKCLQKNQQQQWFSTVLEIMRQLASHGSPSALKYFVYFCPPVLIRDLFLGSAVDSGLIGLFELRKTATRNLPWHEELVLPMLRIAEGKTS